jgi:hypothetical protein
MLLACASKPQKEGQQSETKNAQTHKLQCDVAGSTTGGRDPE